MNKKELFNEEREIPGRQKVVCRSNVPVLTRTSCWLRAGTASYQGKQPKWRDNVY